jgi:hypothetical protein
MFFSKIYSFCFFTFCHDPRELFSQLQAWNVVMLVRVYDMGDPWCHVVPMTNPLASLFEALVS